MLAAEPRRRGRVVEEAILDATLAALAEQGYGFSVDEVAQVAGVHKTTIYRRWETKPALVAAAAERLVEAEIAVENTGDPVRDVTALVVAVARALRTRVGAQMLRAVVAAAADDPQLVDVTRGFLDGRYEVAAAIIREGQRSGVVPADVDPVLLWRAMVNPLHMSAICDVTTTDAMARELARIVLGEVGGH